MMYAFAGAMLAPLVKTNCEMPATLLTLYIAARQMETLPYNGAIIMLLAVTGLTHRQAFKSATGITFFRFPDALVMIAVYSLAGIV